jgi:hypothetical protein
MNTEEEYKKACREEIKKEIEEKFACYLKPCSEHVVIKSCKICAKNELLICILSMLS